MLSPQSHHLFWYLTISELSLLVLTHSTVYPSDRQFSFKNLSNYIQTSYLVLMRCMMTWLDKHHSFLEIRIPFNFKLLTQSWDDVYFFSLWKRSHVVPYHFFLFLFILQCLWSIRLNYGVLIHSFTIRFPALLVIPCRITTNTPFAFFLPA